MSPLADFHPAVQRWFADRLGAPTEPQRQGWPLIREGRNVLIAAPTGSGKTLAAFLSAIDSLLQKGSDAGRRDSRPLRLAAAGPVQRRPEEPSRPAGRDPRLRPEPARGARGRPHRGYVLEPAHGDGEEAAAHPGHDAGVAVPPADQRRRPADAGDRADGDRGRDPCPRARQARLASRPLARAAGGPDRAAPAARRAVGHAEAAGRGRAIPGRHRTRLRARRHGHLPRPRPRHRGPALAAEHRLLARAMGRDLRAHGGAGADPSHHPRLREHAQDGRAHRGPALQAARRGRGGQPSRQPFSRAKAGRGGAAQGGPTARDRGHGLPRARHRHRGRGPRDPGRRHAIDRDVPPARRPLRSRAAQDAEGPALPADAGRARRSGRAPPRRREGHPRPDARGARAPSTSWPSRWWRPASRRSGRKRSSSRWPAGPGRIATSPRKSSTRSSACTARAVARSSTAMASAGDSSPPSARGWPRCSPGARSPTPRTTRSGRSRKARSSAP